MGRIIEFGIYAALALLVTALAGLVGSKILSSIAESIQPDFDKEEKQLKWWLRTKGRVAKGIDWIAGVFLGIGGFSGLAAGVIASSCGIMLVVNFLVTDGLEQVVKWFSQVWKEFRSW